jgi:hypothetical protein
MQGNRVTPVNAARAVAKRVLAEKGKVDFPSTMEVLKEYSLVPDGIDASRFAALIVQVSKEEQ